MASSWSSSPRGHGPAGDAGAERPTASSALLLPVLVSLYILFLPTFGPLTDHHFVEKAPNHAHVYLGGSGPEHAHPFEARHWHDHGARPISASSAGLSKAFDGLDGIVYLAPCEGNGQSVATAILTVAPASIVFRPPGDLFRFGLAGEDSRLPAAFVGPMRRPPRA